MTRSRHRFPVIFLSFVLPFFSIYFINSSLFKLKEIKWEGLNPYLERELVPFFEKLKGKNTLFLDLKDIKILDFPFLEIEIFQKILPDKLYIKFKIKEELATYVSDYGSYDLYKEGFLLSRFKEGEEKFIIEGKAVEEKLKFISEILEKNSFLYESFYGMKIEDNSIKLLEKEGQWIEIKENKNLDYLKTLDKILKSCPQIFDKKRLSFINSNLFIAKGGV